MVTIKRALLWTLVVSALAGCQGVPVTPTQIALPPTATEEALSPTPTKAPPTATPTEVRPTATATDVPPTETPTQVPPTETPTQVPPTETPTRVLPTATVQTPAPLPTLTPDPNWVRPQFIAEVPRLTVDDLATLLALEHNVVVIDTRGHSAYATAHIKGALDIPVDETDRAAPELPRSAKIVLYCA